MSKLAIIGGTGLDKIPNLEIVHREVSHTPYGEPSAPLTHGILGGWELVFLPRHGPSHSIPPHRVNYRANLWGLHALGVRRVVAINAVGGISDGMRPGRLVIPHQLIDYTWGREHTFDDGASGQLQHIDFSEPFDAGMRRDLLAVAGVRYRAATRVSSRSGIPPRAKSLPRFTGITKR